MNRILKSQNVLTPGAHVVAPENTCVGFVASALIKLLADASARCTKYGLADYTRDVDTINRRIHAEGIGFATRTLPSLSKGLFEYLEGNEVTYPGFKLQPGKGYPRFLKGIFYVVYNARSTDVDVAYAIDCIYQISVFFKKLEGPFKDEELNKMYTEFVEVDKKMGKVFDDLDVNDFEVLQLARHYFMRDFADFTVDSGTLVPRPGPGATFSKTPKHMRYEPHTLFVQHQNVFPIEEWFYSHPWDIVEGARRYMALKKRAIAEPRARMFYVPKTVGKARGICIEENESQWLQQALAKGLRTHVAGNRYLRGHVEFNDQGINRDLALQASLDQENATIDMSEASDRIPKDLVSWVSQDCVELHNALMCLSTRTIESSPQVTEGPMYLRLNKYAPMGSGLCFPVMGLMHYYLIQAIVMRYHGFLMTDFYVYGDDIILPSKYAASVFEHLPKFGMKLNCTKSFVRSKFRESCGIHAYSGVDVTPIFFRKIFAHKNVDTLVSIVETEALLFSKGLFHISQFLRDYVVNIRGELPYVTSTSPVVGWKRPARELDQFVPFIGTNALRTRWNVEYQCYEDRVLILRDLNEEPEQSAQNCGYLRWLVQRTEDSTTFSGAHKKLIARYGWLTRTHSMPLA